MEFILKGINPKTGQSGKWKITADNEQAALAYASKAGVKEPRVQALEQTIGQAAEPKASQTDVASDDNGSQSVHNKTIWPFAAVIAGVVLSIFTMLFFDHVTEPNHRPNGLGVIILATLGLLSMGMFVASVIAFFYMHKSQFTIPGYIAGVFSILINAFMCVNITLALTAS
jgi:hypothetical protein